ncbi:class III poly(R)-hydroxyalkanoic acid synthase subunit PhaE [Luteimonas marina]|uniref:Poly(3-hydroxyalkanoate) polymerase subunit PhaE n=1 Tax=Luteimonas marina TaxID=488485 RepID=A0A5C5UCD5_9GAMM|nr:class III poly(R)-hydroxyalkanoic acid synthase subunit PhaE [Luteimonas marina]TWT23285.1 class III poly(R)-hydroxyalkanoic acid synthase subunit PhaE [Luteimonas marina]
MANGSMADFERLARQYWGAWGDAMRGAAPGGGQPGMHAWQDAIDWWTRYAHGGREGVNEALGRFNVQARDWYGHMQQVAAQFAGRDNSARDVAAAWKQALGAAGMNPFPEMFRSMRGHGLQGLDQWVEDASPWLDAMRGEGMSWLKLPAFGVGREHQERLQALAQAQVEYQECNNAYGALMLKASQSAFEIFEDKLVEREEPGRQIESPRALFDLWIDAAEEAYAEIALSKEFREVYGKLVDAQMRLRAGVQREVEQASALLGMPTRTEVDAAHRKIVELERALRRMRDAAEAAPPRASAGKPPEAPAPKRAEAARKPAAAAKPKPAPSKKPAAAKRAARKVAARPSVASRRAPTNGFSSAIPMPVAPLPPDDAARSKKEGR